jgi:hypothetical protein
VERRRSAARVERPTRVGQEAALQARNAEDESVAAQSTREGGGCLRIPPEPVVRKGDCPHSCYVGARRRGPMRLLTSVSLLPSLQGLPVRRGSRHYR